MRKCSLFLFYGDNGKTICSILELHFRIIFQLFVLLDNDNFIDF